MDIMNILENSKDELYLEDLDFFETELATGEYEEAYIIQCKELIAQIRKWLNGSDEQKSDETNNATKKAKQPKGLVMGIGDVAPKEANPVAASMKPEDLIFSEISSLREHSSYKTDFKKYVKAKDEIDEAFIEKHFSFFKSWELDAIISVKQMSENFLEKYFGAISHEKIARYQMFSEGFFMKHYSQLDVNIVLEQGKNEWRKKEKRSKQLDVFLRLKGVKK